MKRVAILWFIFGVFLFMLAQFSSAQTCASADDTILRLNSPTNAHGQKHDQTPSYSQGICYSSIFGQPAPANPSRVCSGSGNGNRVVRLSSPNNAHAGIPDATSSPYATEICYQGLTCQSVAGNVACPTGSQEVVQLSGATNAHLETASGTAYTTANNYKICCSATGTIPTNSATWKKIDGTLLNTPPNVCLNQYVVAHTQAPGFANGEITYWELWEADCVAESPPCVLDDCLAGFSPDCPANSGFTATVQNGESSSPPFQITSSIFNAGGESNAELYFNVAMASQPNNIQSSYVILADNNQCVYSLPTANINAPVHQGIYFANTQIDFAQGCTSPLEPINYQWDITQDGQTLSLGQSATSANFQHTFANTGQATIRLTCTGQVSSLSATAETQILVVASPFVFAYINVPDFNAIVYNSITAEQPYFATQASFSASNSFVVDTNIQGSSCVVNCLAGNCPSATQNSPNSCTGTNGQMGGPLAVSGTPAPYNNMNFDWRFWDNNWEEQWTQFEGVGIHSGSVAYDDLSNARNDKHMRLTATVSGVSATFDRDFTLGRCLNNGNVFLSPSGQQQATTGANAVVNACKGVDANSALDDCCPNGLICSSGSCVIPPTHIDECSNMNEAQCNNWADYNPLAPRNQMPNPPICTYIECLWNPSAKGGQGECGVHSRNYSVDLWGCAAPSCVNNDCTWSTTQTSCQNGQKTISYTGTAVASPSIRLCSVQNNVCEGYSVTTPCGTLNFELGFFGYVQFIVAMIVVAMIYFVIGIRRRDKK